MIYWLSKIDPKAESLKTPVNTTSSTVQVITTRNDGKKRAEINASLQGRGIQNIATIIAAVVFSPHNSTIIIEEPENFLHSNGIEVLIDLFNTAIEFYQKQRLVRKYCPNFLLDF